MSPALTTLDLDNRTQIVLLVHDAGLGLICAVRFIAGRRGRCGAVRGASLNEMASISGRRLVLWKVAMRP